MHAFGHGEFCHIFSLYVCVLLIVLEMSGIDRTDYRSLKNETPYLQACIFESLRLRPRYGHCLRYNVAFSASCSYLIRTKWNTRVSGELSCATCRLWLLTIDCSSLCTMRTCSRVQLFRKRGLGMLLEDVIAMKSVVVVHMINHYSCQVVPSFVLIKRFHLLRLLRDPDHISNALWACAFFCFWTQKQRKYCFLLAEIEPPPPSASL